MAHILIIDDERSIRNTLKEILEFEKHTVSMAENGKRGFEMVENGSFDIIFSDIKMPEMDGIELLAALMERETETPVVMISGHGNIETAVECIKNGAFDFIEKPIDLNRLLVTVRNALDKSTLVAETKTLKKRIASRYQMLGQSPAIERVRQMIERVAPTDARVLITGDNGTGKEIVARLLFEKSNRSAAAFVEVNCAAIPSELIESELFGHEKGSFTSAIKQRIGKFEQADRGTIFLDEIGDMSLPAQTKVLRVLQENELTRVGSDKSIKVDVRVLAATNKDLQKEIEHGNFREDLFHRLNVIPIRVPSLDERKEDIPLLVSYFCETICNEQRILLKTFSAQALDMLQLRAWTGNIRELRNVVERLIILGNSEITDEDIMNFA
jgi:DNA-binding NtrC family response regulator